MEMLAPPPVIACARVLAYAIISSEVPFIGSSVIYVDGVLLGRVPRLAICEPLAASHDSPAGVLMLFCDAEWGSVAATSGESIQSLQARAEQSYPGIAKHWVVVNTPVEEALKFYDEEEGNFRCAFCGKRDFELDRLICGSKAAICIDCVDLMYKLAHEEDAAKAE